MSLITTEEAAAFLLAHDRYTILTHRRPDGDTVGCAIALCRALRALGKTASIYENPQFTARYLPFLEGLTAKTAGETVVAVDLAAESLLPLGWEGSAALCIDHHPSNTGYAALTLLDGSCAACAELLPPLLEAMGAALTQPIADALFFAVTTDTGCFRYSNTTPRTLRTAALLIERGADAVSLNRTMFELRSRARLRLEAYLTASLRTYGGGKIGVCTLPEAEMRRIGATEDDADSIAGFARTLEGVELGALLRELPERRCRISLRTDDRLWNASEICRVLGGGGHPAAAGATVPGDLEEGRAALLGAIASVTGLGTAEEL